MAFVTIKHRNLGAVSGLIVAACSPNTSSSTANDINQTDAGVVVVSKGEKHHAALHNLRKSSTGKPIITEKPSKGPHSGKRFVYDKDLDDPVTRWGECLSLVRVCYASDTLPECIDAIPRCADDHGGNACCPPACVAQFQQLVGGGVEPYAATEQSFVKGECIVGFKDALTDVDPAGRL